MEYDPTGKLNKEIALFHDGISLPVGNVGPVTVSDLMGNGSIRNLINEFMKEEADGRMYVEAAEDFFNKSAYEVALNSPDNTKPYHWDSRPGRGFLRMPEDLHQREQRGEPHFVEFAPDARFERGEVHGPPALLDDCTRHGDLDPQEAVTFAVLAGARLEEARQPRHLRGVGVREHLFQQGGHSFLASM